MRIQLFEFGDLNITPKVYHDFLREFMGFLYRNLEIHKLWLPNLNLFIERNKILHDPCAGSGDVNLYIEEEISKDIDFQFIISDIMTDKVPRFARSINSLDKKRIKYLEHSVDLLSDSSEIHAKVFINSFHHFTPEQLAKVLKQHSEHKKDILVLEYCQKTLMSYVGMVMGPLISMLLFPFIIKRENILKGFLLTYIIPLIPFMLLWDGFVSCFRTYNQNDIAKILKENDIQDVKITTSKKRSLLYPSGVSSIQIIF